MLAQVAAVLHILGVVSAVDAVLRARTPQGSIAWSVSLITFPYLAVPAYWVLGRTKFNGYVIARQGKLREVAGVCDEAIRATREFMHDHEGQRGAGHAAEQLAGMPFLRGNRVELLIDGEHTFASILGGIDTAREYLLVQFFIVRDDELGRELKARLIARARAGVRVHFLYDEVGSNKLTASYKEELRAAGVELFDFHSQKGPSNKFQINFRNHRKIVVADGRVAWIGGHNVGDEYLGHDPEIGAWRDTHIRIEGPAALAAQLAFAEDWHWAAGVQLELDWHPTAHPEQDLPVLIVPSGPADPFDTASLMFVHAIHSATERIWIASPYFVPDEAVTSALQLAGLRGVDVRILIPDQRDHIGVYLAAFSYLDEIGDAGVRFYRYQSGFLHEKVMLIDHSAATVGTANFDNRSFRLNFEITALVIDEEFAAQVERMFEADFERSRLMDSGELDLKPWWFRFGVRLARLTAPIQ